MAINYKIISITIVIIIGISIILTQYAPTNSTQENISEYSGEFFNFNIETTNTDLIELDIDSIFKISGVRDEYIIDGTFQKYGRLYFELDKNNQSIYDDIKNTNENTVVIFPIFTAVAYNDPGFYNYFRGECDLQCLNVPLKPILRAEIGGNGAQILKLLNYNFLSDVDIDKNPEILDNFDKVILLHNEYVTKRQFDALTSHPNVVYLYPNALNAEIDVNYDENGELDMKLAIKGISPQVDARRPIHFNLNLQQNLLTLLKGLRYAEGINDDIDRNVQKYFSEQKK